MNNLSKYSERKDVKFINVKVDDDEFLSELTSYAYFKDRERFYDGVSHLYLPNDVDRCLYIDTGDVLFLSDDYSFYDEDFNGKMEIAPYSYWLKDYELIREKPSMKLIPIGIGGVLYPPKTLHPEVSNLDAIKRTCLKADDLWLKIMQVMINTPTVVTKENLNVKENGVDKSTALWKENVLENLNDLQFNKVLTEYNHFYGDEDTLTSRIANYKH